MKILLRCPSVILAVLVAALAPDARAIDFFWNTTTGDWNTGSNWTPTGPPIGGSGNNAAINNGGTATITADIPAVQNYYFGRGVGASGTVEHSAGLAANSDWTYVGTNSGTGTYNLSGTGNTLGSGSLSTVRLYVGGQRDLDGGTGTMRINTTGTVTASSDIAVGTRGGTGTLNITAGTVIAQTWMIVGETHNLIGGGTGTVVQDGGSVTVGAADANGRLWLGSQEGTAGAAPGTNGTYILNGGTLTTPELVIGKNYGGTFEQNGGTITINARALHIAQAVGSQGTLDITGGSFTQTTTLVPTDQATWNRIGDGGVATVNLSGTANMSLDGRVMIGSGAASDGTTITQSGGTFEVKRGELVIGDVGGSDAAPISYNISSGTLRTISTLEDEDQGGNITIGQWENSRGRLNASGNAVVQASRDIQLAVGTNVGNPTGTLSISDNASVTFNRRIMSGKQHDGAGNGGDNGGRIFIDVSGNGTLRQNDVTDLGLEANWNFIAHNATSTANVTLSGGTMSFDARTFFGRNGVATMTQTGGLFEVRRGELNIGDNAGSFYNISGGTLQVLNGNPLVVGQWQNSDSQLNVSATGIVTATGNLVIGNGDDANGAPLAKGTLTQMGGTVTVGGNLHMGNAAQAVGTYNLSGGTLDLTNGNITKGTGTANFNFTGGRLQDLGIYTLGGTLTQAGGILAPGPSAAAGVTMINADYSLQSDGQIEISIISPDVSDEVNVTGAVSLTGSLLVTNDPAGLAQGSDYIILFNDGVDPISGTFFGLPEGQDFTTAAGNAFDISYVGGDGNDIRLLVVPEPITGATLLGVASLFVLLRRRRSS